MLLSMLACIIIIFYLKSGGEAFIIVSLIDLLYSIDADRLFTLLQYSLIIKKSENLYSWKRHWIVFLQFLTETTRYYQVPGVSFFFWYQPSNRQWWWKKHQQNQPTLLIPRGAPFLVISEDLAWYLAPMSFTFSSSALEKSVAYPIEDIWAL